jgi:hypothetical protein
MEAGSLPLPGSIRVKGIQRESGGKEALDFFQAIF